MSESKATLIVSVFCWSWTNYAPFLRRYLLATLPFDGESISVSLSGPDRVGIQYLSLERGKVMTEIALYRFLYSGLAAGVGIALLDRFGLGGRRQCQDFGRVGYKHLY
ncbi:hypothetical protein GGR54DRAFT_615477 [Hypoxylon sp. NC1633]|nr:hypothetical protein GGR54DRAFT_615477 [Hypoxylon sp. NC1633]